MKIGDMDAGILFIVNSSTIIRGCKIRKHHVCCWNLYFNEQIEMPVDYDCEVIGCIGPDGKIVEVEDAGKE